MRERFKVLILVVCSILIVSCEPENETLTSSEWVGNWVITEDIVFPSKSIVKSHNGTIRVKPSDNDYIIISGELFGMNSSISIEAKVYDRKADFSQMVGGSYYLEGNAELKTDNEIFFDFDITLEDKKLSYERTAVRI